MDFERFSPISLFEVKRDKAILFADFGPIPGRVFRESINSEIFKLSFIFFMNLTDSTLNHQEFH